MRVEILGFVAALAVINPREEIGRYHGVTVYGRPGSPIIDMEAEGFIAAPPERVWAVLLDYPAHPSFLRHIAEIQILSKEPGKMLVYQRITMPVLRSRDMVLEITYGKAGQDLWTHFRAVTDRGPGPRFGVVRVTNHEGGWRLVPLPGGQTYAYYATRIDLAGSLPMALARRPAASDIGNLFDAIRRRVLALR